MYASWMLPKKGPGAQVQTIVSNETKRDPTIDAASAESRKLIKIKLVVSSDRMMRRISAKVDGDTVCLKA